MKTSCRVLPLTFSYFTYCFTLTLIISTIYSATYDHVYMLQDPKWSAVVYKTFL